MKLLRYRKPSMNRILGITKAKRAVRKATGLSTVARYTSPSRIKQRAKQKVGLYSPSMTVLRQTAKLRFPSLLGLFTNNKKND